MSLTTGLSLAMLIIYYDDPSLKDMVITYFVLRFVTAMVSMFTLNLALPMNATVSLGMIVWFSVILYKVDLDDKKKAFIVTALTFEVINFARSIVRMIQKARAFSDGAEPLFGSIESTETSMQSLKVPVIVQSPELGKPVIISKDLSFSRENVSPRARSIPLNRVRRLDKADFMSVRSQPRQSAEIIFKPSPKQRSSMALERKSSSTMAL